MSEGFWVFAAARLRELTRYGLILSGGDRSLADDLVQEALTRTALAWSGVRNQSHPEAYVRRAMARICWKTGSRARRELSVDMSLAAVTGAGASVDDHSIALVSRLGLLAALALLPPRQRAVVVLRYLEDMSEAETAAALHCSVGTVKSQAHRALKALRVLMPDLNEEDIHA